MVAHGGRLLSAQIVQVSVAAPCLPIEADYLDFLLGAVHPLFALFQEQSLLLCLLLRYFKLRLVALQSFGLCRALGRLFALVYRRFGRRLVFSRTTASLPLFAIVVRPVSILTAGRSLYGRRLWHRRVVPLPSS